MSWFDDNWDSLEPEEYFIDVEDNWAHGFHETANGKKIFLKKMTDQHLAATIEFFRKQPEGVRFNTNFLEREVARRESAIKNNFNLKNVYIIKGRA